MEKAFRSARLGWVLLAFLTLSLASAAMAVAPPVLWPVISARSPGFQRVVVGGAGRRRCRPSPGPLRGAGCAAGDCRTRRRRHRRNGARVADVRDVKADASPISVLGAGTASWPGTGQPVLIVSGYGSSWDGMDRHPVPGNLPGGAVSYTGALVLLARLSRTRR